MPEFVAGLFIIGVVFVLIAISYWADAARNRYTPRPAKPRPKIMKLYVVYDIPLEMQQKLTPIGRWENVDMVGGVITGVAHDTKGRAVITIEKKPE